MKFYKIKKRETRYKPFLLNVRGDVSTPKIPNRFFKKIHKPNKVEFFFDNIDARISNDFLNHFS